MSALQGAVESTAPVSRLHAQRSSFPVPTGREEEWRFTPLRRLRGLHGSAAVPAAKVAVEVDAAPEVNDYRAERSDLDHGAPFEPVDRVSAQAFDSFQEATVVKVPAEAVASRPTVITVRGEDVSGAAFGHTVIDVGVNARAVVVDHAQPDCRSRVDYKGALQGELAHTVWIGDVLIRPEATGTDTYERNRNLLLTDGARADSVPNLEILTGEVVGAGHASASGRLEDHHLFYLMARGIPEDEARRLVIRGFFGELIAKIGVPELRDRITEAIEAELAAGTPEVRR